MKPQEKQGCLIGIGLLVSWFALFFLSIEFDSPFLKGISFGLPGLPYPLFLENTLVSKNFNGKPKETCRSSCSDSYY